MPLGIRPTNDFAFKRTFGTPENRLALISLLNAILNKASPIVEVTLLNPYNLQDFQDDKLSILDIKATDQNGAIYNIEMQLSSHVGLIQRLVFYGCELYADQLKVGDGYRGANPVFSICIVDGHIWPDSTKVHHAFRFTDAESGRVLPETVEIHTLELTRYNMTEADLKTASLLECWLYWFLHAHEYEADVLRKLFPQPPIRQATDTIATIAEMTEDKTMYDAREKEKRDRIWLANIARDEAIDARDQGLREGRLEGKLEGEIKLIRTLQGLLGPDTTKEAELRALTLPQLEALTTELQEKLRNRRTP